MAVQTFSEYISTYLADMLLNMLTYFISFNLVSIALHAVARALRIMTRSLILRGVNRMCGGALRICKRDLHRLAVLSGGGDLLQHRDRKPAAFDDKRKSDSHLSL